MSSIFDGPSDEVLAAVRMGLLNGVRADGHILVYRLCEVAVKAAWPTIVAAIRAEVVEECRKSLIYRANRIMEYAQRDEGPYTFNRARQKAADLVQAASMLPTHTIANKENQP